MESDEYSTRRVPRDRSVAWWRIATINVLFSFSLPSLIAGMDLANGTPGSRLVTGILGGSAILTVISILTSIVGARSRLSSYLLARLALVLAANREHANAIPRICRQERGIHLIDAKIVDLKRHLRGGFSVGELALEGIDAHAGSRARIVFQNEFLSFERAGRIEACVPDLIAILDVDTGHPITTDVLRYGQRIAVLALPCHPLLRTPEALAVVGPACFGLEGDYHPLPRGDT